MDFTSACKCLWGKATGLNVSLLAACVVAFILGIAFELSDQALYEGYKPFLLVLLLLIFLAACIPPVIRCAKETQYVWTVIVASLFLSLAIIVVFYVTYFWATSSGNTPVGVDKVLSLPPILIGLWVAGAGWYVHFRASTKNARTANSFNLIMQTRTSSEFIRHANYVRRYYPFGTVVPAVDAHFADSSAALTMGKALAAAKKGGDADNIEAAQENCRKARAADAIKYLLNYYEFMAVGIKAKDLDEEMLYQTLGSTVTSVFTRAAVFIGQLRGAGTTQTLALVHLEELATRWSERLRQDSHERVCALAAKNKK